MEVEHDLVALFPGVDRVVDVARLGLEPSDVVPVARDHAESGRRVTEELQAMAPGARRRLVDDERQHAEIGQRREGQVQPVIFVAEVPARTQ